VGISAEIGRGDGKGAAAGALATELAGVIMQSSLFEPANLNEQERQLQRLQEALNGNEAKEQTARVIGALTGALTTHTPEGAYSGADSAQNVYRYNMTEHMLQQYALDNQRDILAADKGDKEAAKRVQSRREAAIIVAAASGGGMALTAGGMTLVGTAPELVLANTQSVASFIKGETAAGMNLSTKTADYDRDIQKTNTDQLVKVFDPKQSSDKLNVFGKEFAQVLGDGGSNKYGTTKVFATEKLSDRDIIDYAQSLTGGEPFKEVTTPLGTVYFSKKDSVTISLRDYSASEEKTNARWTIEILGNEDLQALQGKVKKKVEIKFR
jgi:hypothetical protein